MKHIGLLLHFYQPPTQDPKIVMKINRECYLPLFEMLQRSEYEITININYSLTEQLERLSPDTLRAASRLAGCSFTGSGAYHPILPLIPDDEVIRQLELNDCLNSRALGEVYRPSGVFPPEMAVNEHTVRTIGSKGYRWTITDDVPWVFSGREAPFNWIPAVDGTAVFLRSNFWSNRISFHGNDGSAMADRIYEDLKEWTGDDDSYVILAMDGETYGHHRTGAIEFFLFPFLERITELEGIRLSSLDRICSSFPLRESDIPEGSWSTTFPDLEAGEPFPLWSHSANQDHRAYLKLLRFVMENSSFKHSEGVADEGDKMLYSCPLWWASSGRESYSQVRRGILMIIKAALEGLPAGELLDRMMELAGKIPAMARRDR
ncbi:hypothetical protein CSA37_02825 [Candidatus Fermentibacteria bacterium]|nr:MAG: hypothetical protein CSA37_02825 [Candidatus Fermentibacteria bacterium]